MRGGVLEGVGHAVQVTGARGYLPHFVESLTEGRIVMLEGVDFCPPGGILELGEIALHNLQFAIAEAAHRGSRTEDFIECLPGVV